MRAVHAADFDFELPQELIAQRPLPQRTASRLLVLDPRGGPALTDAGIRDLVELLEPRDLLVFNDTRVIPARLRGQKPSGGAVEMLLERPLAGTLALLHMRASKPLRPGQIVHSAGGDLVVEGREEDLFRVRLLAPAIEFFSAHGEVPLPPYIERRPEAADLERYQSVLARVPGAVAAPTASLHFDAALLEALAARGIRRTTLTLHVGAGTFQPLRSERIEDHVMHAEWAEVPATACAAIAATRAAGGRVVAIGTTVVRALESAALASAELAAAESVSGVLAPWTGETRIFITPGFRYRAVDALLTNFHLPRSTLIMLVSAFAGREFTLAAYAHAVAQQYRFFSYGDAMFITSRAP
ncbi:MAG: tRNA preQ1(34) S-adenosylmethionine ribosyltransferase-isomerase QueA [Gammaproteobacteria bacterium]|nr:tRNA preQ1(34) S-adenosylmethionine ribosyltransferase-isomerase QueA [Gammaproteobacteria bacterium]